MNRMLVTALVVGVVGCRELSLGEAPSAPQPGTISGRAVVAVPGRSEKKPAAGAFIRVLPSGLATRADDEGLFVIEGVTRSTGELLLQLDGDSNGSFERQRLVRLDGYRPGLGRQVQLGELSLEENAVVRGRVLRADVMGPSGHGGAVVFVPEGPFTTTTADDGRFLLDGMPPGTVRLAYFRAGYESRGYEELTLASGEELTLRDVTLAPLAGAPGPGRIEGQLVATPATPLDAARVEALGTDGVLRAALPEADGHFTLTGLSPDLYRIQASLAGYRTVTLSNVLVSPGGTTALGRIDLHQGATLPLPDAGHVDAGPPDAGAADAGPPDAGPPDAGPPDAGPPDAGPMEDDAGAGDAGPVDAGPDPRTPTAVLPATLAARPGQELVLDGSGSTDPGGAALIYHWAQTLGPTVTFSVNDSTQPTTRITAPTTPGPLRFVLKVSNVHGLASEPATLIVTVQAPPTAKILPGSLTLRTGLLAQLDGRASSDPAGGALDYQWAIDYGPLTLEPGDAGLRADRMQVRAGAQAGVAEVRLTVVNALGLRSEPALASVIVTSDPVVVTADAGGAQLAGIGQPVVLRGSASSTNPGDDFVFDWAQVLIDGGAIAADAGVSLSSSSGPVVSFTTPSAPQELFFRLTVTGAPSGATASHTTRVVVIDDQPPALVDSDPPLVTGGTPDGPWWELKATFDEPIDPASLTANTVRLYEGDAGVGVNFAWLPASRTVTIAPKRPLALGATAELVLEGVTDATAQKNALPLTRLPFKVRAPIHRTRTHSGSLTAEPLPVPLITGRDTGFAAYYRPNSGCGASPSANFLPLNATGFNTGFESSCGCGRNEQRNHAVVGNRAFYSCGAGALLASNGNAFAVHPGANTGPNSINTDGVSLGGSSENYGLLWSNLLPTGWATPWTLAENVTTYLNSGSSPAAFGGGVGGGRNLALGVLQIGSLRIFEQVPGGPFTNISEVGVPTPTIMPRGAYVGTRPVVCHTHLTASQLFLRCLVRDTAGTAWRAHADVAQGPVERIFDVQTRGDAVFVAYAQAGSVKLKWLDASSDTATFVDFHGPSGAPTWNVTTSCQAKAPALQLTSDGVWVAFQEHCGSSWTVVLRKAE